MSSYELPYSYWYSLTTSGRPSSPPVSECINAITFFRSMPSMVCLGFLDILARTIRVSEIKYGTKAVSDVAP